MRDGTGAWINDPLNPDLATDPFGANSVCQAYGYVTPAWSRPDPSAPAGRIEALSVQSAPSARSAWFAPISPPALPRIGAIRC